MRGRNSGPRSNAWSKNKATNYRDYDPQQEEISRTIEKYFDEYFSSDSVIVRQNPTHQAFVMPVTRSEIECELARLPTRFVHGLKAVFLLGGSNAQLKQGGFAYGRYSNSVIYLHPYPRDQLVRRFSSPLKPHVEIDYKRAGAILQEKPGEYIVEFTVDSLRQYYLRDVLMHEIGHHVDRPNFKRSHRKEEGFAEWFATEYGFRLSK